MKRLGIRAPQTANALRILSEQHAARQQIFENEHRGGATTEKYSDGDSENPLLDMFNEEGGQEAILKMCGFTRQKLQLIYHIVQEDI